MFQIALGFFKNKRKLLFVSKNFGNGTNRKLLDQIFLVMIENVLFRSRILFQKPIYSIFFGTKAAKRKLSILKERWFDIASRYRVDSTDLFCMAVYQVPTVIKQANSRKSQHLTLKSKKNSPHAVGLAQSLQ
jgi:hypothetical protein